MNKTTVIIVTLVAILAVPVAAAASEEVDSGGSGWAIDTSTSAFIGIYILRAEYEVWEHGDLALGAMFRTVDHEQGHYEVYSPVLAYRQYLWRKLHLEYVVYPAYSPFTMDSDGSTHTAIGVWSEVLFGYKFEFDLWGVDWFVIPQPGIGFMTYTRSEWPKGVKPKGYDEPDFIPSILFGINL